MQSFHKASSLLGALGCLHWQCAFLTSTTWRGGRKRLIYARQVRRWATANSSGSTLRPDRNKTQKDQLITEPTSSSPCANKKKWQKHTSAKWVVDAITSFSFWSQVKCSTVLLIMESWRRSCQRRLLLRGNLLLHPDSAKMWPNREMSYVLSLLRSQASTHKSFMATHRLKCSMIFSSRTFSGKFPTHKCLVSRTILCAPAPLSCRWVFPLSVSLCAKWKRSANFTPGKKRGKILGANHWLVVVTQCKPLDPRTLFDTLHCWRAISRLTNALETVPVTRRVPDTTRPLGVERKQVASQKDAATSPVMRGTRRRRGFVCELFFSPRWDSCQPLRMCEKTPGWVKVFWYLKGFGLGIISLLLSNAVIRHYQLRAY